MEETILLRLSVTRLNLCKTLGVYGIVFRNFTEKRVVYDFLFTMRP